MRVTPAIPVRRSASSRASTNWYLSEEPSSPQRTFKPARITRSSSVKYANEFKRYTDIQISLDKDEVPPEVKQPGPSRPVKKKDSFLKTLTSRVGFGKGTKKKEEDSEVADPQPNPPPQPTVDDQQQSICYDTKL